MNFNSFCLSLHKKHEIFKNNYIESSFSIVDCICSIFINMLLFETIFLKTLFDKQ